MGWLKDTFLAIVAEPPRASGPAVSPPFSDRIKPRPVLGQLRAPTREAFKAWRDDPITRFVLAALDRAADVQHEAWVETSWQSGIADEKLLAELRTRADAYRSIEEADYEGFCEWLGVEPEPVMEEVA